MNVAQQLCTFDLRKFATKCSLPAEVGATCWFHHARHQGLTKEELEKRLREMVLQGNGNWVGFIFPQDIELPALVAECKIDARGMDTKSFSFNNCQLREGIDLSGSRIEGSLVFQSGEIHGPASLSRIVVEQEFRWAVTAHRNALFDNSHFKGPAKILGEFNGDANFAGVVFYDAVEFVGSVIRYINEPHKPDRPINLFNDQVNLNLIDFRRPNRTRFRNVDLRKAYVCDTDFRGVYFYAVNWEQASLGRRGLFDEVVARESDEKTDNKFHEFKRQLPRLEAAYRNLRAAHEDSKDYQSATDFYVGELECRRRRLSMWMQYAGIEALYKLASNYGSSPLIAFRNLVAVLLGHMVVSTAVVYPQCFQRGSGCTLDPDRVVNSTRLLTILGGRHFVPLSGWAAFIDIVAQVLIAIQVALLIFALRSRIRRG